MANDELRALLAEAKTRLVAYQYEMDDRGAIELVARIASLIDRITAALAEKDGGGWMPIETAPRDGKIGLLIAGGTFCWEGPLSSQEAEMTFVEMAYWNKRENRFDDSDGGDAKYWYKPTHWQPLPTLPTERKV